MAIDLYAIAYAIITLGHWIKLPSFAACVWRIVLQVHRERASTQNPKKIIIQEYITSKYFY